MKNLNILNFSVFAASGDRGVLFGEGRGRQLCKALIAQTPISVGGILVGLDFEHVEHASASFLRESVLGYAAYLRNLNKDVFPFVSHMNEETKIEFSLILRDVGTCFVSGELSASNALTNIEILGLTDGQHSKTLAALRGVGEASVAELRSKLPENDRPVGTALNGRLEWLSQRGLLRSRQDGREKRYSFPFTGD